MSDELLIEIRDLLQHQNELLEAIHRDPTTAMAKCLSDIVGGSIKGRGFKRGDGPDYCY